MTQQQDPWRPAASRSTTRHDEADGSDAPEEMSYVKALYITFWKPIFIVFGLAHMAVAAGIIKLLWPNAVGYVYVVGILLAVPVAYVELEWLARKAGWDEGPIFDWRERATVLLALGYGFQVRLIGQVAERANEFLAKQREQAGQK